VAQKPVIEKREGTMRKLTRRQFVVGAGAALASIGILRKARAA
jgi:hypothetical protein